jgi:catechol 2,3-dioxygenase-like lactoylglutathione lyase family enzyme
MDSLLQGVSASLQNKTEEEVMLDRVDRVQIAVRDLAQAATAFTGLLGAEVARESKSAYLSAKRTVLAVGESEIELCTPDGEGRLAEILRQRGEGLITAGFSTPEPGLLRRRIAALGYAPVDDGEQFYLEPAQHFGMRFVISKSTPRLRVGPVSFLYEVTNTLSSDWRLAASQYSAIFGLDTTRFSAIHSARFKYDGTLTLFNPPDRLDRIEISQVNTSESAMGRWAQKWGDSMYMCYVEAHDLPAVIARLNAAQARWTPRGGDKATENDGLWVHPSALHGLLLGVSRSTLAWHWSGRPELVVGAVKPPHPNPRAS